MSFRITSNGPQVAKRIEKALSAASQTATGDRGLRGLMQAGIARHFRMGRMGAGMTAVVGNGAKRTITWDTSRHPTTMARNGDRPILEGRKRILSNGFIRSGFYSQTSSPGGSRASYGPRNSMAVRLGRVHQFGGKPLPGPSAGGYPSDFTIPARPFVFWDSAMVEQTIKRISRNFEEAAR